jgi:hypothetical protein
MGSCDKGPTLQTHMAHRIHDTPASERRLSSLGTGANIGLFIVPATDDRWW